MDVPNIQKRPEKDPKTSEKDLKNIRTKDYPKNIQKHPINIQKESEISEYEFGIYNCNYCDRGFTNLSNMRRHELHRCKKRINLESIYKKEMKDLKKDKEQLYKHIEALIKKAGNTTTTNNLNLNSYGKEDLSHITDSFKTNLIKGPFRMIPKMIEAVHFNDKKPENKNIELTNSRDNKLKVFTGDKWIYKNKEETINDLLDGKYFILDSHYENICEDFNNVSQSRYETFRSFFDEKDKKMYEQLKKECELVLLNNR